MAGISMITALTIQNNGKDITSSSGKDEKTQKWCGFIHLYRDGRLHCELLSTEPAFESSEDAEQHMKDLINEIRRMNLSVKTSTPQKEENSPITLSCPACNYVWESDRNVEDCPRCEGHGRPDPKCTCSHYRGAFGIGRINVVAKYNPDCPIHKNETQNQQTSKTP